MNQELSKKISFISDVQVRSANDFKYTETFLLRPALQNKISEAQSTAAGYAYLANWKEINGSKTFNLEHQAWQQYNIKISLGNTEMNHRLRLEQRFLDAKKGFDFAQRLRYYIRSQIPLVKDKQFKKGMFLAFQNEIYLNIQNKANINNRLFDQNRLYGSPWLPLQ